MSEGIDALLKERGRMYGEAVDNFTAVGRGWGAILNIEDIPPYQVALMMDFLKTIRCAINPNARGLLARQSGLFRTRETDRLR
jgi:hypothetical protein